MMKGADQCPKCASTKWVQGWHEIVAGLDFKHIRLCKNCHTMWEFFDEAALLDAGQRYSSFVEPCDNCAFRPGSPEQKDPVKWKELLASLEVDTHGRPRGTFFCHKGVALDHKHKSPTDSGYFYPVKSDGSFDIEKNRPCRGYYKMVSVQMRRVFDAEEAEHEQAGIGHA